MPYRGYWLREESSVGTRLRISAGLAVVVAAVVLLSLPGGVAATRTITYPFIAGSYVIPMDGQQTDLLHAFGLVHAILRAGVPVYRVLSPPAVLLKVDPLAPRVAFDGGPFLVWGTYSAEFAAAAAGFPGVTYLRLAELEVLDRVLPIKKPTGVLILRGGFDWGHTGVLLDQLGIPYDLMTQAEFAADPGAIFRYALVVDDCNGWSGRYPGDAIADAFRIFVAGGGHAIFTDIALKDMEVLFPGHLSLFTSHRGTYNATVHTFGDAPSQYFGPDQISVYTEIDGVVMGPPVAEGVNVLLDLPNYPYGYQVAYRILAADFARLGEQVKAVEAYADIIHVDVMDAHFVPPLTIGPVVVESLRPVTGRTLHAHLMVERPQALLEAFAEAGTEIVTFHVEAASDPGAVVGRAGEHGMRAGIAVNPETEVDAVFPRRGRDPLDRRAREARDRGRSPRATTLDLPDTDETPLLGANRAAIQLRRNARRPRRALRA